MRKMLVLVLALATACSENYSNGERVGLVTQFSRTGLIWKSWEGHLNMTQTGMNSSQAFDFSVDNDRPEPADVVETLKTAADSGWKVELKYHEVNGYNWFSNRGHTDHFITSVKVLDKTPVASAFGGSKQTPPSGRVVDTVYVVIVGHAAKP